MGRAYEDQASPVIAPRPRRCHDCGAATLVACSATDGEIVLLGDGRERAMPFARRAWFVLGAAACVYQVESANGHQNLYPEHRCKPGPGARPCELAARHLEESVIRPGPPRDYWVVGEGMAPLTTAERLLVEEHLPLVRLVVRRMNIPAHLDRADLEQEGLFGLVDAIRRFDASRGYQLGTYAVPRIRGWVIDALRRAEGRGVRLQLEQRLRARSLDALRDDVGFDPPVTRPGPEQIFLRAEAEEVIDEWIDGLDQGERYIVEQRVAGRCMADIGAELGITESRVCQILAALPPLPSAA